MKYGQQVGVIVYGGGIDQRHWINDSKARGFVVVLRDGCATIHRSA